MKKVFLFFTLAALSLLSACDNTDTPPSSTFTLTFKAMYDGQPLEKYRDYDYDTYRVNFIRFNTFMSDLALLNGTNVTALSEVEWVDFTPDSATDNFAVEVPLSFTNIPDGDYTGLRMGFGVAPDMNNKRPSDYPADHPLARENEYWLGWASYIFNKIEGQVDLDNNGVYDGGLIYHCGSDAVYRIYDFNVPITVGQNASATVEIDLKKVFQSNGSWLDLNNPYNHITSNDANDVVIATVLMDNFDEATTVRQ